MGTRTRLNVTLLITFLVSFFNICKMHLLRRVYFDGEKRPNKVSGMLLERCWWHNKKCHTTET